MLKVGKYKAAFLCIKEIKKINCNSLKINYSELILEIAKCCRDTHISVLLSSEKVYWPCLISL